MYTRETGVGKKALNGSNLTSPMCCTNATCLKNLVPKLPLAVSDGMSRRTFLPRRNSLNDFETKIAARLKGGLQYTKSPCQSSFKAS